MNQTKKRLSIIKIAISITDIETIQLQVLKLGLLKTDEKIQDIISMLQAENYAQAQGMITIYIETATENILQRSSQEKKHILTEEEESTIDEFQLFVTPEGNEEKIEVDINDFISDDLKIPTVKQNEEIKEIEEIDFDNFLNIAPIIPSKEPETMTNNFDTLLNLDVNDVLTDNIDLNINYTEEDNFFKLSTHSTETLKHSNNILKDTFFDIPDEDVLNPTLIPNIKLEEVSREASLLLSHENIVEKNVFEENILQQDKKVSLKELSPLNTILDNTAPTQYKSIPYITQKLESMHKQYPSPHNSHKPFSTLSDLLTKISQETYTEEEVEETIATVRKLMKDQQFPQAVQLLLVSAATPSPFAKLILARELYKGILLTKNIPQAFILLNTLAMDDYPEALCDLGQFYENGIGTKKDKKRAKHLYKDAMDFGIKRAKTHFERLNQQNKGFFKK